MSLNSWLFGPDDPDVSRLPPTPTAATMGGTFDPSYAGAAATPTPTPTDWAKIAGGLGKLGGTGQPDPNDWRYLRTQAQAAPFEPGSQGLATLLATLMQMHRAAALAQQPQQQPQPVRASLLG